MSVAGVFGHKPITPGVDYVEAWHQAHSLTATLAGISITVAFAWQAVRARNAFRAPGPSRVIGVTRDLRRSSRR